MNSRELFLNILHYRDFDRMPVFHWGGWTETRQRWLDEGMPADVPEHQYFGVPPYTWCVGPNVALDPPFEEEVYEETDDYRVLLWNNGSIVKLYKNRSSLPEHFGYTLNSQGEGWDQYKRRLQPAPHRLGVHFFQPAAGVRAQPIRPEPYPLPETLQQFYQMSRELDVPVCVSTGSIFGWIRDWVGVEQLAYMAFDNPALLEEIIETITDLVVWGLEEKLPHVKADLGWGWEDICFRNGPLVSPSTFKKFGVPAYRRISDTLRRHGVDLYLVDCDGLIDSLIPHWLEAGVNVMFPMEIGAWDFDPFKLRKQFGNELLIFGGIDKRQLVLGPEAIDAELSRRRPLMEQGGFVPLTDHLVHPEVPLANYRYYLEKLGSLRF